MSEFMFVGRHSIYSLDFTVIDENNMTTAADAPPMGSYRSFADDTEVFQRAFTAKPEVGAGVYRLVLSSLETAMPGLYYVWITYDLLGVPQAYRVDIEVPSSTSSVYESLNNDARIVIEQTWMRFEDMFDSAIGGPNLKEYAQSNFGRERIAQLMGLAMNRLNTTTQPHQSFNFTDQPFPYTEFGGLLELATYCVAPETRVLRADLSWVPAGEIVVGDDVVAFDEQIVNGKFRTATIEHAVEEIRHRVRVETTAGEFYCTPEHRFVVRYQTCEYEGREFYKRKWVEAQHLIPGRHEIVSIGDPWEEASSFDAGYLSGLLDGEGCLTFSSTGNPRLIISQKEGPVLDRASAILKDMGNLSVPHHHGGDTGVMNLCVSGGFLGAMRVLGATRPERLLRHPRFRELWDGTSMRQVTLPGVEVLSVTPSLDGPVSVIQTSTGTLITEGLLSHNCEVIKHLIRSYVEQPTVQGVQTARFDRSDYYTRWITILHLEEDALQHGIDIFKMSYLGLGNSAVLVGGGVFGEWARPMPLTRPRYHQISGVRW